MPSQISISIAIGAQSFPQAVIDAQLFFIEAKADGYTASNEGCIQNELLRLDVIQ